MDGDWSSFVDPSLYLEADVEVGRKAPEGAVPCDYSWVAEAVSAWISLTLSMEYFSPWTSSKYFWRALRDSCEETPLKRWTFPLPTRIPCERRCLRKESPSIPTESASAWAGVNFSWVAIVALLCRSPRPILELEKPS